MRILLITAFFYPQNVIASARVGQWAQYWAKAGHHVTVLTTKKYPFWPTDNIHILSNNIRVIEVDYLPLWLINRLTLKANIAPINNNKIQNNITFLRFIQKKLRLYLGELFDIHDFWPTAAIKIGKKILKNEKFELIISSYSPQSSHIIANTLKKIHPSIPWIADFRDLWADNHIMENSYLIEKLINIKEKRTISAADLFITISDPLSDTLKRKYKNKIIKVIPNGFDPDEHIGWVNNIKSQRIKDEKIIISYTGIIYSGKRDPTPLFNIINKLIDEEKIAANEIEINFYGNNQSQLNNIIKSTNSNKHHIIQIHGQIPRIQSLRIQKESNLLLLLEWNDESARGVLTGKLFEYLVSGRPILAVGIDTSNAAGDLIHKTKTGISTFSEQEIERILLDYISYKPFENFDPKLTIIEQFSRDNQSLQVLDSLNEI